MKRVSLRIPVITFIAGGVSVYLAQTFRDTPPILPADAASTAQLSPTADSAAVPKPVSPSLAQASLEARIDELQAALKLAESQRDEVMAILRVTPSPKADPDGTIFSSLVDADGKPVATYDTANRVFHYNPADAVALPGEGKIMLNRKTEIAADLKSAAGDQSATLRFENETKEDVYLFWIDYEGQPVLYDRIRAGETSVRPTYMTHPWVVTDLNGKRIGDVKPELANQTEVIPVTR